MNIRERVFWITGASSGIGEALALELAKRGAALVISARREDRLHALRSRCPDPTRVAVLPLDVADTEHASDHVRAALEFFGRVDVMVHNAGVSQRGSAIETSLGVHRRIMEVNYFGVVALTKALLPSMLDRGRGHFVVVSSVVGYVGTPDRSAYAASKHALHGYFESLRVEAHVRGVKITMVCPGFVATELRRAALTEHGLARGRDAEINPRAMSSERCAHAIVHAIETEAPEIHIGGREIAAIYLRRFAPRLLTRLLLHVKAT